MKLRIPVLADQKAAKIEEINQAFDGAAAALMQGYPAAERHTWPRQEAEARAWQEDPDTALTPYLDELALARGIAREDMLARTLENVLRFERASVVLIGKRQMLVDRVAQATGATPLSEIRWA